MTCGSCKSQNMTLGTTTFTVERDGVVLVIREVPAHVCTQCGEEFIEGATHERLEALVAHAERDGVQFAVRSFGEPISA